MAISLLVTDSYASISEADVYLENNTVWSSATDETKTDALIFSRHYIDSKFVCDLSSYDVIPDELKYANSLLAADYVADTSVFDASSLVKSKSVRADVVSSSEEYVSGKKNKPKSAILVESILKDLCTKYGSSLVNLIRA